MKTATAALALSITFRNTIIGDTPVNLWMLNLTWILLAVVPFTYLLWHILSGVQFDVILCEKLSSVDDPKMDEKSFSRLGTMTAIVFIVMGVMFFLGILFFVMFALANNT